MTGRYSLWHGLYPMQRMLSELVPGDRLIAGDGARVQDAHGKWYVDASAGLGNAILGYSDARTIEAICDQARQLPYAQVLRHGRPSAIAVDYANMLADSLPGPYNLVRFYQTGSEAVEAAALLSKFVRFLRKEPARHHIVSFGGWHGVGAAAGAISSEPWLHEATGPLMPHVHHLPAPTGSTDVALKGFVELVEHVGAHRITAAFMEPVLGLTVEQVPSTTLEPIAAACERYGVHLVVDEITTGTGRTGKMVCVDGSVEPDLILLSKGLAAGYVPLSAVAVHDRLYADFFNPDPAVSFPHASTSSSHPLAMAAGSAVLHRLRGERVMEQVVPRGQRILNDLTEAVSEIDDLLVDVRGVGLMLGITVRTADGRAVTADEMSILRTGCTREGVIVNTTRNCINLMPPYTITDDEHAQLVAAVTAGLHDLRDALTARPAASA